jgi:glycosyltransferase involved in cell wall biosynthesis
MRILHIGAGNLYGGVEMLLSTLARYRHLCPDMTPEFALCFDGRLEEELISRGVPFHDLGEVRIRYPFSVWRARRCLQEILASGRFDAVVCHNIWPQVIFGPTVRGAGTPLVFWAHNTVDGRYWLERWARRINPALILCNSRFTERTLSSVYPGVNTEVIYYPVAPGSCEPGTREAVRRELETTPEAVVIVQVSRLEEWKGHRMLLNGLGLLRDVPGWTCWIVGGVQRAKEAPYLEALKNLATHLQISDRIRFVGQRSDVPRLLAAADVFCQPNSGPEAFGIVFVEALYAGLPVVATAIGGAQEIVDASCGRLVPPADAAALRDGLAELIGCSRTRQRLGSQGLARARALCDPKQQLLGMQTVLSALGSAQAHTAGPKAAQGGVLFMPRRLSHF